MNISDKQFMDFQNVIGFEESRFKYPDGNGWNATTLVETAKKQGLKPFKLYFNNINIGFLPFSIEDMYDFIVHVKRINNTDIHYPVILSETGLVIDGWHRIAKGILNGDEYIMAVRLNPNPEFDFTGEGNAS